jgi:hypothetical protein
VLQNASLYADSQTQRIQLTQILIHRSLRPAPFARVALSFPFLDGLALKLVLTPALIGAVSMAGRRWGPGVSGWLVGFPLRSGPVAFFLALDQGVSFAAGAAAGSMTGAAAQALFCVLYGRWARGRHFPVALLAGSLGFAAASVVLQHLTLTVMPGSCSDCSPSPASSSSWRS